MKLMGGWYAKMNSYGAAGRPVDVSDWADLRVFLAIVDGQTLMNAADILIKGSDPFKGTNPYIPLLLI